MISKKVLLFLAITFSVVISVTNVKAHYIPDDDHDHHDHHDSSEESSEQDTSKVAEFFENIKCGITHGAKKIKDGVTSGYNYIKSKIVPGSTDVPPTEFPANVSEIFPTVNTPMASFPADIPITIPTSTSRNSDLPVWDIDVRAFINETDENFPDTIIASTTPKISVDDRSLFDAPSFCPEGELKDRNGRCRKVA